VEEEYHRQFLRRIEAWLDAGHGTCVLGRRDCAKEVATALEHFTGTRVTMFSFVVMPNHVHVLFDRLVRNEQHFARCVRYIRSNPEKAHLWADEHMLYESNVARAVGTAV
jgi:putative transposase